MRRALALCLILAFATQARANIFITEWMYSGNDGEFIELCNLGGSAVDMTGWSYDDSTRIPGSVDLGFFGQVDPGECVLIAELDAATFAANWGISGIDILGENAENLGRADEINIYDASMTLVDRLTFGDNAPEFPGSIRTQNKSGYVSAAGLGTNNVYEWTLSDVNDVQHSFAGVNGNIGSPGSHVVPEPAALGLIASGFVLFGRRARRRF